MEKMRPRRRFLAQTAGALCLAAGARPARAGAYPDRPIRLIVCFDAGGTSDIVARLLASRLTPALGQTVIVENYPGANGILATRMTQHAPPDGYTITIVPSGHAINSSLNKAANYDPVKDFSMISLVGTVPMVVTASLSSGIETLPQLIAQARRAPGKMNYGSGGVGASNHLATELLAMMAGIRLNHIPYRGDAPGIDALLGGQITFALFNAPVVLNLARGHKARPVAITSAKRSPLLPDVPTVAETLPGYEAESWHAIIGPAGIPGPVVARLNGALTEILHQPDIAKRFTDMGIDIVASSPDQLRAFVRSEVKKWRTVIQRAHVTL